jgi:transcriptional regulator with XRE-family HTH domain
MVLPVSITIGLCSGPHNYTAQGWFALRSCPIVRRAMQHKRRTLRQRLARNLRRLRGARGWTQPKLAEAAESSTKFISDLERAKANPRLDYLEDISDALSIDVTELLAPGPTKTRGPRAHKISERQLKKIERVVDDVRRGNQ